MLSLSKPYLPSFLLPVLFLYLSQLGAQPGRVRWLEPLRKTETIAAAKLPADEKAQIVGQLEKTSFDVPDSWDAELVVRRVSLGASEGLLIRGTKLLCGGTGNCETWMFRRVEGQWQNLFEQEAPVVSSVGFSEDASSGILNLYVTANTSAASETRILFKFDGRFYRQSRCFDVSSPGPHAEIKAVPCA